MKITVKNPMDLTVAARLAEQIGPLNKFFTETHGVCTKIRSLAFESATMGRAWVTADPEQSAYYWELTITGATFKDGIVGQFSSEITPVDDTPASEYLTAVLSWMYTMETIEPALGQEFGFDAPWILIEEI
jgi:hypothetical protein